MLVCKLRFHYKFHLWFYILMLVPVSHKCACYGMVSSVFIRRCRGDILLWKGGFDTSASTNQALSILKMECEILQLLHIMAVFLLS